MRDEQRISTFANVQKIVIKIGTQVITDETGRIDPAWLKNFAAQVNGLIHRKLEVVIVSSGAIGAGIGKLNLPSRPAALPELQAIAALGQSQLMHAYEKAFAKYHRNVAQILLTWQDFDDRTRFLNARNAARALAHYKAIPIINENDSISTDEIKFGDNDLLSALVANMVNADALIILSGVEGLYRSGKGSEVITCVREISEEVHSHVWDEKSCLGSGGMGCKLEAVDVATKLGKAVVIANGRRKNVLLDIMDGKCIGTLFLARGKKMLARKKWIGYSVKPKGQLVVDEGAATALVEKGKSLLSTGIIGTKGKFTRGDVVSIRQKDGQEIARGLVNYSSAEVDTIKGLKTSQIAKALGSKEYDEVIHRDNMVIL